VVGAWARAMPGAVAHMMAVTMMRSSLVIVIF
jgi:hypothetical protein